MGAKTQQAGKPQSENGQGTMAAWACAHLGQVEGQVEEVVAERSVLLGVENLPRGRARDTWTGEGHVDERVTRGRERV